MDTIAERGIERLKLSLRGQIFISDKRRSKYPLACIYIILSEAFLLKLSTLVQSVHLSNFEIFDIELPDVSKFVVDMLSEKINKLYIEIGYYIKRLHEENVDELAQVNLSLK